MTCSILLSILCIWASVLLRPTSSQTCWIDTSKLQWYLNRSPGYDLNVLPAWRNCINGTGVTVGVVDRGVQDHIDLDIDRSLDGGRRRQAYLSQVNGQRLWYERHRYRYDTYNRTLTHRRQDDNYNDYRSWMSRRWEDNLKHGTRVAGIIAAKYNDIGVTGIAFGAKIADIRIASSSVFETFEANLLNHRSNDIDIYSCSFANFHTGTKSYSLRPEQEYAFNEGTTRGRGGLGSVYVFGTGNSGGEGEHTFSDSCAYDRLVTNRYVISVAGIQHDLQKLPSGEECAAMLVAAFTASPGSGHTLRTTDIRNSTTTYFNQNSAAVPMVSGAVALALSIRPDLGYRDIMHLLVDTSRSNLTYNGFSSRFIENAAGLRFSSVFGFGLLDVSSLVESSRTWQNVPKPVESCTQRMVFNNPLHRDNNNLVIHVSSCAVTYIEHVEVTLSVRHPKAGQIKWVLISPYGTRSTILPGRRLDPTVNMDLTVLTVQLWGENPNGYWKLEPSSKYNDIYLDGGTLNSATLTIYGTTCGVLRCLSPAQQDVNSYSSPWAEWSRCSVTCGQGYQTRQKQCAINNSCVGQRPEQRQCNLAACPVRIQSARNQSCPSPNLLPRVCAEHCSSDGECYGGEICCYNGCGHTCIWPANVVNSNINFWSEWSQCSVPCGGGYQTRQKQCGRNMRCVDQSPQHRHCNIAPCPVQNQAERVRTNNMCPSPNLLTRVCAEHCSSDRECDGQKVCCDNGCGHTCEWPNSGIRRTHVESPRQECVDRYSSCDSNPRINCGDRTKVNYNRTWCRRTCGLCE